MISTTTLFGTRKNTQSNEFPETPIRMSVDSNTEKYSLSVSFPQFTNETPIYT